MKLGNLKILNHGKIVIGPQPSKLFITVALLTVPLIIIFSFGHFPFNKYYIDIIAYVLLSLTYLFSIVQTIITGVKDPGIIPSSIHAKEYFQSYIQKNIKNFSKENQLYMFFTQPHANRIPFHINRLSYRLTSRFCQTCKFFKPQRSTHSSKANLCIQRYDHYCFWLGHDIGLLNHWDFYLMNFYILVYIGFCAIFAILEIIFSLLQIFTATAIWQFWVSFASGLIVLGLFSYFCYSMGQLVKFHYTLLLTGSLTKEDLGSREHNFQYTAMYNRFSIKENFMQVKRNSKNISLLQQYLKFMKKIQILSRKCNSLEELELIMRKELLEIEDISIIDIIAPTLPKLEDDESESSTSDRFSAFFKPGWDKKEVEKMIKIMKLLTEKDCIVPFLCDIWALKIGSEFVVNDLEKVEQWKKDNQNFLTDKKEMNLLLTCGKSKSSDEVKTNIPVSIDKNKQIPGISPIIQKPVNNDIKTVKEANDKLEVAVVKEINVLDTQQIQ